MELHDQNMKLWVLKLLSEPLFHLSVKDLIRNKWSRDWHTSCDLIIHAQISACVTHAVMWAADSHLNNHILFFGAGGWKPDTLMFCMKIPQSSLIWAGISAFNIHGGTAKVTPRAEDEEMLQRCLQMNWSDGVELISQASTHLTGFSFCGLGSPSSAAISSHCSVSLKAADAKIKKKTNKKNFCFSQTFS